MLYFPLSLFLIFYNFDFFTFSFEKRSPVYFSYNSNKYSICLGSVEKFVFGKAGSVKQQSLYGLGFIAKYSNFVLPKPTIILGRIKQIYLIV